MTNPLFATALAATLTLALTAAAPAQTPPPLTDAQRAAIRAFALACRADAKRLCANVELGQGRVLACLQGQTPRLSPPCRAKLASAEALKAQVLGGNGN